MSQYPNPPQPPPQPQWGPPPPRPPQRGVWIAVAAGAALLVLAIFAVTAFAAPGFLVDDSGDSSNETSSEETDRPGGQPEVEIPPPNASGPETGDLPPTDDPEEPDIPETAPAGGPEAFAMEFLALVAGQDAVGVNGRMCAADQEWQYEDAVNEGRELSLTEPREDATAPDGILADLSGPEGTVDGRITVIPDDVDGWCVDTFYVF